MTAKIECLYQRKDDPRRNESIIFAAKKDRWVAIRSFVANGKLIRVWLHLGAYVKISSCGEDEYFLVNRGGLRKVKKQ